VGYLGSALNPMEAEKGWLAPADQWRESKEAGLTPKGAKENSRETSGAKGSRPLFLYVCVSSLDTLDTLHLFCLGSLSLSPLCVCVCVSEWPGSGKPVGSLTTAQDGRVVGSFPVKLICFNSAQFFGDFHFLSLLL
jgi:hypothetical protein